MRLVSTVGRLRAKSEAQPFHVVLVEPEIPPNTGNIARLCGATKSVLHLVGKLGFRIDDQAVRRAGLDYWHLVEVRAHATFDAWLATMPTGAQLHFFTAKARTSHLHAGYVAGDALIFGKESVGLDPALLERFPERHRSIPTLGAVRSLNLANAASIVLYEALRVTGALDKTYEEGPPLDTEA
jgi:tRNA (cytidine/uridine-2'-O-)-methyltransferase